MGEERLAAKTRLTKHSWMPLSIEVNSLSLSRVSVRMSLMSWYSVKMVDDMVK